MKNNSKPRRITVSEMAPHVHSFAPNENKVNKIAKWLESWIKNALKDGSVKPFDFLPSKGELACHIGVSIGTMQNVFRILEDIQCVESKQRIGTYVKTPGTKLHTEKLTSIREIAVEKIKNYIITQHCSIGNYLISSRKLAENFNISNTTIRSAINTLISDGILEKVHNNFVIKSLDFKLRNIENETLVEKIAQEIKLYIEKNCKCGDKLPPNKFFSKQFNVSIKTVYDAIKLLSQQEIVQARRGRYGTIVLLGEKVENKLYNYEQIELKIRNFIINNCEIGTKLPSIVKLSEQYKVSPKTIKKALDNLAEDGYLTFSRGRWGGTFVMDIPQNVNEAYQWLALSSDYISEINN